VSQLGGADELAAGRENLTLPGRLYGGKRLAQEGLVREVRTERQGNWPERTVYEITREGLRAFGIVRTEALQKIEWRAESL
jgi:DNA-binding PadR family transcriptional regulator